MWINIVFIYFFYLLFYLLILNIIFFVVLLPNHAFVQTIPENSVGTVEGVSQKVK